MPTAPATPDSPPLNERQRWLVLIIIAIGTIGAVVLSTSFNVAIPALMQAFNVGNDDVQLAVTTFMVTSTIAMLPTPWLIQRFGLRFTFLGAVILLTVSSILGAFSPTFNLLLIARSVQGICAGVLFPLGTFAVMSLFPPDKQGRASGFMGFAIVLAPSVAPALGGIIIDYFGWEAVFYVSLPFCLIALFAAPHLIPAHSQQIRHGFDWNGMLLLSVMTLAMLGVVSDLRSLGGEAWLLYMELVLVIATLLAFMRHAARHPQALISLQLLRIERLLLGLIISGIYGFGIYGSTYLIPLYLQTVVNLSATHAGAILVPGGIGLALSLPLGGWLADRYAPNWVVLAGLIMLAISFLGMTFIAQRESYDWFVELTLFGRIGSGFMIAALNQAAMQGMSGTALAQSAMFISYVRQLGGVLGVAAVAVYIAWRSTAHGGSHMDAQAGAFAEAFLISAVIFALASVAAWRMRSTRPTPST